MKNVEVKLEDDFHKEFRKKCIDLDMTTAQLVKAALKQYIEEN